MSRRDDIFNDFISHPLILEEYEIEEGDLPSNVDDGLSSDNPIVKSIAIIIDGVEGKQLENFNDLRTKIITHLNTAI